MNMVRAIASIPLLFGMLLWLILVLASMLFPPKPGSAMRLIEKALVLLSSLLIIAWFIVILAATAPDGV